MNHLKFHSFLRHLTLVYTFLSLALLPAVVTSSSVSSSSSSSSSSSLTNLRHGLSQIQQPQQQREEEKKEQVIPNVLTSSRDTNVEDGRDLMQFWKVYAFVSGGHCPPGPLGEPCRKAQNSSASSSGGSSSGSSSGNGGSSSSGGSSSGGNSSNAASNGDYYNGSSSSSSSSSSSGGGGGGGGGHTTTMFSTKAGRASLITLTVAAALVAFGAAFIGMRSRKVGGGQHPLHGAIKKRSTLFTNLANRVNCAKGARACEGEYGQMV